jgi:hypothetical protein
MLPVAKYGLKLVWGEGERGLLASLPARSANAAVICAPRAHTPGTLASGTKRQAAILPAVFALPLGTCMLSANS